MTPTQQSAIEQAAKKLSNVWHSSDEIMQNHFWDGVEEMGKEICTNPEKYGLIPLSEALEFAEWCGDSKYKRDKTRKIWTDNKVHTTSQLWEEFQEYKNQKP